jgi:hypothetical protein
MILVFRSTFVFTSEFSVISMPNFFRHTYLDRGWNSDFGHMSKYDPDNLRTLTVVFKWKQIEFLIKTRPSG